LFSLRKTASASFVLCSIVADEAYNCSLISQKSVELVSRFCCILIVSLKRDRVHWLLLFTQTDEICKNIAMYNNLFATEYTGASILSYHCKRDIIILKLNYL